MRVAFGMKSSVTFMIVVILTAILSQNIFAQSRCGTLQAIKHHQQKNSAKALARSTSSACAVEDYYDSVLTRKTEHFQIFYVESGPHKAAPEFIDSVASSMEYAWNFHTKNLGMLPPLGSSRTFHYQQEVDEGLFPVEIIDLGLLRNTNILLGGICSGCYGLTIPSETEPDHSQLLIDNDFYSTPTSGTIKDTVTINGKQCSYSLATFELTNTAHNYSYTEKWDKAIRVTAIHELYHAVQVRYLDMYTYWSFWFEASASGVEELAAPEIDDYYSYLPKMFSSTGTPLDKMSEDYGAGIFFIYLHNLVHKNTDKIIWEGFAKNPEVSFQNQLIRFASGKNLSADSLFHDFSTRVSFSGNRANFLDSTELISKDQKDWPNYKYEVSSNSSNIKPAVNNFAYKFYSNGQPNLENFKGKGSAVLYKGSKAEIIPFTLTNEADNIFAKYSNTVDSIAWIFSNFEETEFMPTEIQDSTLRAYPTPWRGGNLCFTPLPRNKNYIEIRNRRGNLISREKFEGTTHCLEERRVKELMVPGVYRFRVGNHGKTKDLLIIY